MINCILNYLNQKTRIIVTNALNYLESMDKIKIIYMKSGTIEWIGSFNDFQNHPFYEKLMKVKIESENIIETRNEFDYNNNNNFNKNFQIKEESEIVKLIKDEEHGNHKINIAIYIDYIKYMGGFTFLICILLLMIFSEFNLAGGDFYITNWTKSKNQEYLKNNQKSKWKFFIFYCCMEISVFFFTFLRIILIEVGIIRLERLLHKDMIIRLIKAPINLFHEIVPRGEIYNRLSKDLGNICETSNNLPDIIKAFLTVFSSFVLCGIYDIYSLLFIPAIFIIGYYITKFFLNGSRPLRRMAANSSSPILNIISETLSGISTIRAFEDQKFYKDKFFRKN